MTDAEKQDIRTGCQNLMQWVSIEQENLRRLRAELDDRDKVMEKINAALCRLAELVDQATNDPADFWKG